MEKIQIKYNLKVFRFLEVKVFVTRGSIWILCSLILTGKEGQDILGPEAQADEAGCTGTLLPFPFVL